MTTTGSTYWDNRAASRANQPAQPDTSLYTLAAQNAEIDPTEQDYSPYAVLARRQAQRNLPVTEAPASYIPKVIGPAWTPPPGWVHSRDGWNPPGTPEGVRTPMPAGYETYRRDGSSTNTTYAPGTTSQAYNNAQTALGGTAAPWPVSTGGIDYRINAPGGLMTQPPPGGTSPGGTPPPSSSGGQPQLTPGQIAANNGSPGTGTGPGGTYTFDDQARDRYGNSAGPGGGGQDDPVNTMPSYRHDNPTGSTAPNTVAPVSGQVGYEARQLSDPTKWNVTDDQTVAGQVRKLIAGNDEIQQMETTRAKQGMNAGGLMSSTMGLQAVEAARYAAALPIAQADAGTYGRAAAYNADTKNQFAGKNVDASNTAYGATANIRANTARDTAATIAQANLADKQGNISAAAAERLAGVNAQTAAKLAQTNAAAAVLKAQNDISLAAAGAVNEQTLTNLKANLQKAQIGQEQTVLMARELSNTINSINMNKDLDVNGKTAQIDKAIKAANNTFAAIYTVSQLTGTMLQFTKDEEESAPPPPPPPPPSGGGLLGPNNRNGIPPD